MLKELQVKNFAIIDDAKIKFSSGLNILTGETGAGKTLIIEAMNLLIGERADSSLIRENEESLLVQGFFDFSGNTQVQDFLLKEGFIESGDNTDDIAISRELNRNGRNRAFINGIFTQANNLKVLGKFFIDIHGQHEHQYLLEQKTHLNIIDRLGKLKLLELKNEYNIELENYLEEKKQIDELKQLQLRKIERLEDLKFRLKEIEELSLKENEDEALENEKNILKNSEKIFQYSNECLKLLNGDENQGLSLIDASVLLLKNLNELLIIDKNLSKFIEELSGFSTSLDELNRYLNSYIIDFEFSPRKLESIQERIFTINEIKKKYNMQITDLLDYANKLKEEIISFEEIDGTIDLKLKNFENSRNIVLDKAIKLSGYRKEIIKNFEAQIKKELLDLSFKSVKFEVEARFINGDDALINGTSIRFTKNGIDDLEFLISLNIGESLKSLNKVASGGEISRIMLALKSIISKVDNINTMVFDEIDTGIGGETAAIVGEKLFKISENKQVICITHLAQIACFADRHLFINKYIEKNKTKINISILSEQEKIQEISRMLSGRKESDISLMHAEELINQSINLKVKLKEAN
ncbi:MAG: DNA repair protein RecN [Actinobacteria bacterium]|nr:DNA repair protein RecN [Actinomycetota bacterium]